MKAFYFQPEKLLIARLENRNFKHFDNNDRELFEKNIHNVFKVKMLFREFYNRDEEKVCDSIAADKAGNVFLVGYKKNKNEKFLEKYLKQALNLFEEKEYFIELARAKTRNDSVVLSNMKLLIVGSNFTQNDIDKAGSLLENEPKYEILKKYGVSIELHTWMLIDSILLMDKIKL